MSCTRRTRTNSNPEEYNIVKDDRAIMIMYTYAYVDPKTASHITILVAENSLAENHEVVDDGRTRQVATVHDCIPQYC